MKNLKNLKGANVLQKVQQKSIHGGGGPKGGDCTGQANGTRCNYQGHFGCPGVCINQNCVPW